MPTSKARLDGSRFLWHMEINNFVKVLLIFLSSYFNVVNNTSFEKLGREN